MKLEMEIVPPSSYLPSSNWFQDSKSSKWTPEENKLFENALAIFDKDTPDRWQKVAAMIPGKTVGDVIQQYEELEADVSSIEAGLIPVPGYSTSQFTLDWVSGNGFDHEFNPNFSLGGKRSSSGRPVEHERKKGVPWTEEEHKLFLLGLKKYGKGDWRNISRNYVVTRTPTQVASHAQKYFIRQLSGGKDKRRASIHDITTVNIAEPITPSTDNKGTSSSGQSLTHTHELSNTPSFARASFSWNQPNAAAAIAFNPASGNLCLSSSFRNESYDHKIQGHNSQRSAISDSFDGTENTVFKMQPAQHYHHE